MENRSFRHLLHSDREIFIFLSKYLHDNGEDRTNQKKRSVRLYPRIFPFIQGNQ